MADAYSYLDDPDFHAASLGDKNAYLMQADPDFAKASPQERSSYLNFVHYGPQSPGIQPGAPSIGDALLTGETPAGVQLMNTGEAESIPHAVARMGAAVPGEIVRGVVGGITSLPQMVAHPIQTVTQGIPQYIQQNVQRVEQGDPFVGLNLAGQTAALRYGVPAAVKGAINASPTSAVIEHPALTKGAAMAGGAIIGHGTGEFGGLEGIYVGSRFGDAVVKSAEEKAISQAVEGTRSLDKLPTRLMPRYVRELAARANAYARQAIETGQDVKTFKLPTKLQEATELAYEEHMKMNPQMPNAILTPEEIQTMQQRQNVSQAAAQQLRPEAQARGMAHAAGQHQGVWVPSTRGVKSSTTRSYKLEPQPPPK